MGRPRRQEPKRALLLAAAGQVLAREGLGGLRVREVAAEAQVSPASVLYYFPDSFLLAVQAFDVAVRTLASDRAAIAASIPDPLRRLTALIDLDLSGSQPGITRALAEAPLLVEEHPGLLPVLESMLDGEVEAYSAVIEDGVSSGVFSTDLPAVAAARGVVHHLHAARLLQSGGLQGATEARAVLMAVLGEVLDCVLVPSGEDTRPVRLAAASPARPDREHPAPIT